MEIFLTSTFYLPSTILSLLSSIVVSRLSLGFWKTWAIENIGVAGDL